MGFTFSRLYRSAISLFMSALRGSLILYFLYFSWMALIWGAAFCILSADFIWKIRSGSSTTLIRRVCRTMAHPQLWV